MFNHIRSYPIRLIPVSCSTAPHTLSKSLIFSIYFYPSSFPSFPDLPEHAKACKKNNWEKFPVIKKPETNPG
jgi:hypothetical protein